jgi:sugar/nucleoside kinase (ribokinase family)
VPKVEIKDTSGAGDTFIAGLAVEFVRSGEILRAIEFANRCATRVVQKRGVTALDEEVK